MERPSSGMKLVLWGFQTAEFASGYHTNTSCKTKRWRGGEEYLLLFPTPRTDQRLHLQACLQRLYVLRYACRTLT